MRRGFSVAGVAAVAVAVIIAATSFIRLPYDTIGPGDASDVSPLVTIKGHPSFRARGQVLTTTVAVRTAVNPYQALGGWLDPTVDVLSRQELRGDIPDTTFERLNREAMADSKIAAQVVALHRLGFTDLEAGAEISAVDRRYPGAAQLRPGDVIVAVNGTQVKDSAGLVAAIGAQRPGDTISLDLAGNGDQRRQVRAELGRTPEGNARLGVQLTTKVELPFEITIDSGSVSGPSAALAYGLEVLDLLTPGELTGGGIVAATGELSADGKVGPVGGVRQKTVGVRRAGAKVFLVPKANEAEARAAAGSGMRVIAVADFDEAIARLGSLEGSNALALGLTRSEGTPTS